MQKKRTVMQHQGGFTLIELMIVVAIVGILASVAVPAYSDYTVRAQITEGVSAAAAAKTSVADYYYANGELPTSNAEAGLGPDTTYATDVIKSISIQDGSATDVDAGTVVVSFNAFGGDLTNEAALAFIPSELDNSLTWTCSANAGGGNLPEQYAPANCR